MRNRKAIRREADDLSARFAAVLFRSHRGQHYTMAELLNRVSAGKLLAEIAGDRKPLDAQIMFYVEKGIPGSTT